MLVWNQECPGSRRHPVLATVLLVFGRAKDGKKKICDDFYDLPVHTYYTVTSQASRKAYSSLKTLGTLIT